MQELDDYGLLSLYASESSKRGFADLVKSSNHLVYSTALRRLVDPNQAKEIT
jgi:hypothetical protein